MSHALSKRARTSAAAVSSGLNEAEKNDRDRAGSSRRATLFTASLPLTKTRKRRRGGGGAGGGNDDGGNDVHTLLCLAERQFLWSVEKTLLDVEVCRSDRRR